MRMLIFVIIFAVLMACFSAFTWYKVKSEVQHDHDALEQINYDTKVEFNKNPHDIKKPGEGLSSQAKIDLARSDYN